MGRKLSDMVSSFNGFVDESREPIKLENLPVIYADRVGRNRFIYSKEELINGIDWWKKMVSLDPTHRYIFIKHPADENEESYTLLAGYILDLYYNDSDNSVRADIELIPTIWGLLIAYLVKKGYPVATSLRGSASKSVVDYVNINGRDIKVKRRVGVKIEGFDFVVFPSFMITQVTNNIRESRSRINEFEHVIDEFMDIYKDKLSDKECRIFESFKKPNNNNEDEYNEINIGGQEMGNKTKDSLRAEIDALERELNEKKELLEKYENEISEKADRLETLTKLLETKKDVEKMINEIENKLNTKKKELEEVEANLTNLLSMENKAIYFNGKVYSDSNPPKIRILDVKERYSKREINKKEHNEIAKLLKISFGNDNEKLSKLIVEFGGKLYSVCDLVPSESNEYDFDCLYNINLVKSVFNEFNDNLYKVSKENFDKVIDFIENSYKKFSDINLLEEVNFDKYRKSINILKLSDDSLSKIVSVLITNDKFSNYVEKIKEQTEINEDKAKKILMKIVNVIMSDLGEDEISQIASLINKQQANEEPENTEENKQSEETPEEEEYGLEDLLKELLVVDENIPSPFAEYYGIKNGEELYDLFGQAISGMKEGNFEEPFDIVRNAVLTWTAILTNEIDGNVKEALKLSFDAVQYILSNYNDIKDYFNIEVTMQSQNPEENNQNNSKKEKITEKTNKNTIEEDEMFEELKKMLMERFEIKEELNNENILQVLATILDDYVEVKNKMEEENKEKSFEELKAEKIEELKKAGVSEEVINMFLENVDNEEDLEKEYTKLKIAAGLDKKKENKEKNEEGSDQEENEEENKDDGLGAGIENEEDEEKIGEQRKGKAFTGRSKDDSFSNLDRLLNTI